MNSQLEVGSRPPVGSQLQVGSQVRLRSQWLVMAKAPVAGRVKTRLCPPCTPAQAAAVAAAALADTMSAVGTGTIVLSGQWLAPAGWPVVPQRGDGLADRLHHAFLDTGRPGTASLLVGMDTPQLTPDLLRLAETTLASADAVLGPAEDGGWWTLGLRDPRDAAALVDVPMSTDRTGDLTLAALRERGLRVALLPRLRDVDTAEDAYAVARECAPDSAYVRAVATYLPAGGSSLPAGVRSLPAGVRSLPAGVRSLPAGVRSLPAGVRS